MVRLLAETTGTTIDMDIDSLMQLAADHKWYMFAAVLVGGGCRWLKSDSAGNWWTSLPLWAKRTIPILLGGAAGCLESLASGRPLEESLIKGALIAGLGSMAGHELLIEKMRGGKELGA